MNSAMIMDDVAAVLTTAEKIKNDETQRFPEAASVGDFVRQGDVFITLLDRVPSNCTLVKKPSSQLVSGNTQGSRHCVRSLRGVKVYGLSSPTVYDGPIIESKNEMTIEHPEHGDWVLPAGCYAISYQRTEDSEGGQRRVED